MINPIKIAAGFLSLLLALTSGCTLPQTNDSNISENADKIETKENTTMELSQKSFIADSEHVKLIGRTAENDGILWLALSASGVEFTFTGTSASVTVVGDSQHTSAENQARMAIYVDGEKTTDVMIDSAEKTFEICSNDASKETTVKILKLSEAMQSMLGIKSIDVMSEGDIRPTAEKSLKIEFIGDSITCGYGVDDEVKEHHFKTSTEDATKAYAYKTAAALDADYSLVSYSGHGIISGYTDSGTKVESQQLPKYYEIFANSYGSYTGFEESDVAWDFSRFVPDYVVINLGTNDASYCGNDREKVEEYIAAYVEFLKTVRSNNPNAHIIASLGVMDTRLCIAVNNAAEQYTEQTGDTNISTFRFTQQDGSTGYAADWHPTEATQTIAAEELTAYFKEIM